MKRNGILGSGSNCECRIIRDLSMAQTKVDHVRALGQKIVLTSGSFDMLHIGHLRYLEKARSHGDFLVVGVDSDEKVRNRKPDEYRPVVPEDERSEVLCHSRSVDLVVIKPLEWDKGKLILAIRPDVLVIVEGTYPEGVPHDIREACAEVITLPRQAETSTSAKIRRLLTGGMNELVAHVMSLMPDTLKTALHNTLGVKPEANQQDKP